MASPMNLKKAIADRIQAMRRRSIDRMSFRARLMTSTFLLFAFGLVVSAIGERTIHTLFEHTKEMSAASTAADWLSQASAARIETGQNIWAAVAAYDLGKAPSESYTKDINSAFSNIESNLIKYDAELKGFSIAKAQADAYQKSIEAFKATKPEIDSFIEALQQAKLAEKDLKVKAGTVSDKLLVLNDNLSEIGTMIRQKGADSFVSAQTQERRAQILVVVMLLAGTLIGLVSIIFALGATRFLNGILYRLKQNSQHVANASKSLLVSGEELASGATEQSSALQQTASATEQLKATVARNADSARQSSEYTSKSSQMANTGRDVVGRMIKAIRQIETRNQEVIKRIEESNSQISQIVSMIEEIGKKTQVINEIVFQTKLLSFNASVEAARAGEHGKGFAVVAEEVGNLARMSGSASDEIKKLLDASVLQTRSIIESTRSNTNSIISAVDEDIRAGAVTAQQVEKVFDEIVASSRLVSEMTESISSGASEQDKGISEIASAMNRLEALSTQNQSAASSTTDAAKSLADQVSGLDGVIVELGAFVQAANSSQHQAS